MNLIFKLVLASIALNFASGIIMNMAVLPNGAPIFNISTMVGMPAYNAAYTSAFESNMNKTIRPQGVLENIQFATYRLLDTINLGFVVNFFSFMDNYLYGMVNVMEGLFGGYFANTDSRMLFFGMIKTIVMTGYLFAAWQLWTGKDVLGDY